MGATWAPFEFMRERKHRREFRAAVVTYLGGATYSQLSESERARVDAEVSRMLGASFTPATAMGLFTDHWEVKAQTRARAMRRLGINPVGELSWKDFIPVLLFAPELDLFNQFNPYSSACSEAEKFLIDRGVSVQAKGAT